MLQPRVRAITAAIKAAARGPIKRSDIARVAADLLVGERGEGYLYQPRYKDRKGKTKTASIFWWRVSINGRKHALSTGKTTRKEARIWAIAKLAELREGDVSCLTADHLTLDRLEKMVYDDYAVNRRKSKGEVKHKFARLRSVLGGKIKVKDITTARLRDYAAQRLAAKAAPATINLDLAYLARGLSLAARDGLIPPKPRGWLPLLAVQNARQGFFERPEFEAVRAEMAPELRPLMTVAYVTGWRVRSELLTRQWRHVDLQAGWLRLEPGEGKTGEGRAFPLTAELRAALEAQRAYTDTVEQALGKVIPWVFHRDGERVRAIVDGWRGARERAGVPNALLHDFRRTAVRNMERAGVPRSVAMACVGHRTEAIYRRYAVVSEPMIAENVGKLDTLHEADQTRAGTVVAIGRKRG